jgi:enoyl-CoA hydratase
MDSGLVLYEARDRVATITLNRPEVLNAIVSPMWQELNEAIAEANRDPEVRVIVLRGAGRGFCAGFDFGARVTSRPSWRRSRAGTPAAT